MKDCLFCKIVAGEIPSETVYENGGALAILDITPVNHGHTLVIPKKHSTNIFDIESTDWASVAEATRKVASAVRDSTGADGLNVGMNNGEAAGQIIFHPHVHIIPRYHDDGLKSWSKKEYKDGEMSDIATKIRKELT